MKKLLFVTALLAMGTMAMGAAPKQDDTTTADVEVRAEIVEDSLVITDIYGKPLLLNFGPIQKTIDKVWTAQVEYKVSAGTATTGDTELTMALGTPDGKVTLKHVNSALQQDNTLDSVVTLDADQKVMKKGATEVRGKIFGSIAGDLSKKQKGMYREYTTLTATVGQVQP